VQKPASATRGDGSFANAGFGVSLVIPAMLVFPLVLLVDQSFPFAGVGQKAIGPLSKPGAQVGSGFSRRRKTEGYAAQVFHVSSDEQNP
jgi:hypothetical protein